MGGAGSTTDTLQQAEELCRTHKSARVTTVGQLLTARNLLSAAEDALAGPAPREAAEYVRIAEVHVQQAIEKVVRL